MRRLLAFLTILTLIAHAAPAQQTSAETGSPAAAFAGGPIKLSKAAAGALSQHFHGDKVPIVPQPFRGRLDSALMSRDWPRIAAAKQQLAEAKGAETVLLWEQTRFLATGGSGIAALHAKDLAATGATGLAEASALMWLYAAAVTFTDGNRCAGDTVKDARLEALLGPDFDAVTKIIRSLRDERLTAMRDLAIRMEGALAQDRVDDRICLDGIQPLPLNPDAVWKPRAASARAMLARHLQALCATLRPARTATGATPPPRPEPLAARLRPASAPVRDVPAPPMPPPMPSLIPPVPQAADPIREELKHFDAGDLSLSPAEPGPK